MDVKGTAVATIPLFVRKKFGVAAYDEWLGSLDSSTLAILNGPISPADWYPMQRALVSPTKAVCDMFFEGNPAGAVEQGRFSQR